MARIFTNPFDFHASLGSLCIKGASGQHRITCVMASQTQGVWRTSVQKGCKNLHFCYQFKVCQAGNTWRNNSSFPSWASRDGNILLCRPHITSGQQKDEWESLPGSDWDPRGCPGMRSLSSIMHWSSLWCEVWQIRFGRCMRHLIPPFLVISWKWGLFLAEVMTVIRIGNCSSVQKD